jgi:hypothetical protein
MYCLEIHEKEKGKGCKSAYESFAAFYGGISFFLFIICIVLASFYGNMSCFFTTISTLFPFLLVYILPIFLTIKFIVK